MLRMNELMQRTTALPVAFHKIPRDCVAVALTENGFTDLDSVPDCLGIADFLVGR